MSSHLEGGQVGRAGLALIVSTALILAMVALFAPSTAQAEHVDTWPSSNEANQASYWETWGLQHEGEADWACVKDDSGGNGDYVMGNPPAGSVWRLLVVKAGSAVNELHWNPEPGEAFQHSIQGGWSHVIVCSVPEPEDTTTTTEDTTTTTEDTTTTTEDTTTTTSRQTTTTASRQTTTTQGVTSTTAEVLGTSITAAPSTTADVAVTSETLPFTGFQNGTTGLVAMLLVALGAVVLVGARLFAEDTE